MFKQNHPAKSARTLSLGLTVSSMFGMITVFTLNQNNADLQALKDQQMLETAAKLQSQQVVTPAVKAPTKSKSTSTSTTVKDTAATTVAPADPVVAPAAPAADTTVVAPAAPAAPAADTTVVAPAAPAPVAPAPAPASNTTTSGSK